MSSIFSFFYDELDEKTRYGNSSEFIFYLSTESLRKFY